MTKELEDIRNCGWFRNPPGVECKYFTRTRSGAVSYAELAAEAFGDGPFWIVTTTIDTKDIRSEMCVSVDGSIEAVVVISDMLSMLSAPLLAGEA